MAQAESVAPEFSLEALLSLDTRPVCDAGDDKMVSAWLIGRAAAELYSAALLASDVVSAKTAAWRTGVERVRGGQHVHNRRGSAPGPI